MSPGCRLTVTVRPTRNASELAAALDLRVRVFSGEQGVDAEEELDDLDESSLQLVAMDERGVLATCRLRAPDQPRSWKLERMVVERRARRLGVGTRLLAGAEREARERGASEMILNAQVRAEPFYSANGYRAEGDPFTEAGIEHVRMRKELA